MIVPVCMKSMVRENFMMIERRIALSSEWSPWIALAETQTLVTNAGNYH